MKAVQRGVERRDVAGLARAPVVEAGAEGEAVREAVRDGEAAGALQLGQHNDHLPSKTGEMSLELIVILV